MAADDTDSTSLIPDVTAQPVTAEGAVISEELPQGSPKDLFAALLAVASEDAKAIARELGMLLGLHSAASIQADMTGDYKAGDLNR